MGGDEMVWKIHGGKPLCGTVTVQGAKNSALPILAATLLCETPCVLQHCPDLSDVDNTLHILQMLGCRTGRWMDAVTVESGTPDDPTVCGEWMQKMRSSILFLGALLGRCGKATVGNPGGCALGARPIDLHLSALKEMGVTVVQEGENFVCTAENGLHGAEIRLPFPSVGATENILLAAVSAKGSTVLFHAAKEPEIVDLANFLNRCGAEISGAGTDCITVRGGTRLHGTVYTVMPDRIAAMTYLCAAAVTGGRVRMPSPDWLPLRPMLAALQAAGCAVEKDRDDLILSAPHRLSQILPVQTGVYPLFPTDAGPLIVSAMCGADGIFSLTETVFDHRFRYVNELQKMGADITVSGATATVRGAEQLYGAAVDCTDLRGGAAVVLAALAAQGTTEIGQLHHILRGYEKMDRVLCSLGAELQITE